MQKHFISHLHIFLCITIISLYTTSQTSIAIDFGSEYITTTVIAYKKPIQLIENPQSKTKTNTYLSIANKERTFGYDALSKIKKSPSTVFHHLQHFLAQKASSPSIDSYLHAYYQQYDISSNSRGQITFKVKYNNKEFQLTSEELIAMMFKYIKAYADKYAKSDVSECVIAIPCYYTYKQRQAIINAVELSGMRLLRLIHDNTAAAVKFFSDNKYTKEQKMYIFYNMGDSSTQVSLIAISSTYQGTKKDMIEEQNISILDETFIADLGGRNFDYVLAKLIYTKYQKEIYNNDISETELNDVPKDIIQRLLPYARKYKEVLSANKEINIKVLGIDKTTTYESFITRKEFIDAAQHELQHVYTPIKVIMERNNLNINQIEQIEFIGGGHRIPEIKHIIERYVPESKMGIHLNGDDAIAFGAGLYASDINGLSNVIGGVKKKIVLHNSGHNFNIKIYIDNKQPTNKEHICKDDEEHTLAFNCIRSIHKNTTVFKRFFNFTKETTVSFNHDSDFIIKFYQQFENSNNNNNNTSLPSNAGEHFLTYHISNINSKLLQEIKKENPLLNTTSASIRTKLTLTLDKLGIISIKGELIYKVLTYYTLIKPKSETSKIEFKYLQQKPNALTDPEIQELITEINKSKYYSKDEKDKYKKILLKGDVNVKTKIETKKKFIPSTYITVEEVYPYSFNKDQLATAKNTLKHFDDIEKQNAKYAEKKNALEALIYDKKDFIANTEVNVKYAQQHEIETVNTIVNKVSEWYNDKGDDATLHQIEEKIKEIKNGFETINTRIEKEKKRNHFIKYFHSEIASALRQGKGMLNDKPWVKEYYEGEFKMFIDMLKEWMEDMVKEQGKLKEYEEQYLTKDKMEKKLEELRNEVKKMKNMQRPIEKGDL